MAKTALVMINFFVLPRQEYFLRLLLDQVVVETGYGYTQTECIMGNVEMVKVNGKTKAIFTWLG